MRLQPWRRHYLFITRRAHGLSLGRFHVAAYPKALYPSTSFAPSPPHISNRFPDPPCCHSLSYVIQLAPMFCKEGHLRQSLVDGSEPRDSDGDSDEDVPLQHEGTHMQRIRQFRTRHVLLAMAFANVGLASSWAGNVFHVHSQACAGQDMRTTICGGVGFS